jgi:hypothetical protein
MLSTNGSAEARRRRHFERCRAGRPQEYNLVAGLRGGDPKPNGERALTGAVLARDESDRLHAASTDS